MLCQGQSPNCASVLNPRRAPRGFTLIELLVTITILAVLIIVVVVLIDPNELFAKTRDTRRFADLAALRSALTFSLTTSGTPLDLDGANTSTCGNESKPTVYVSLPTSVSMHDVPTGWSWKQVAETNLAQTDGSGWLPLILTGLPEGSPLFNLPVDPRNKNDGSGSRFFYSYGCSRAANKFEFNAMLESKSFGPGGESDKSKLDGGDAHTVYELGSGPNVLPTSGIY